jgi:hypothetical protein
MVAALPAIRREFLSHSLFDRYEGPGSPNDEKMGVLGYFGVGSRSFILYSVIC